MNGFTLLTGVDGLLRNDAYPRLIATMYYSDCPDAIDQATGLIMHERQRYTSAPREAYKPTSITNSLHSHVKGQQVQTFLAGYMGLALIFRARYSDDLTDGAAHTVVTALVRQLGKEALYATREDGEPVLKRKFLNSGRSSLKSALNRYRSVLPICAASVVAAQMAVAPEIFKERKSFEEKFINTALFFQAEMDDVFNRTGWARWHIDLAAFTEQQGGPTFVNKQSLQNIAAAYNEVFPGSPTSYE